MTGATTLNDGFAAHMIRPGDPGRNKLGVQGSTEVRRSLREFKRELTYVGGLPCCVHDHEPPITHAECLARTLWILALIPGDDQRWASNLLLNRWLGRAPLAVEIRAGAESPDLDSLPTSELLATVDRWRSQLAQALAIDVEPQQAAAGSPARATDKP